MSLVTTRDLKRMRPLQSPAIAKLSGNLFALLASSTPEGASLRTAFLPALTRSSTARFSQTLDDRLRSLLTVPPTVVVIQGTIQADAAEKLWEVEERGDDAKARSGMGSSIYLSFSLHTELLRAIEEREEVEEANLSIMILATLVHEVASWIYVKVHGYTPREKSGLYSLQNGSNPSQASFASSFVSTTYNPFGERDRSDVGDLAVVSLIGADLELLTYSIGERQLVKRRLPTRRSALLTPPLIYALTHNTPSIMDVTSNSQSSSLIPAWKSGDSMYSVVSTLGPAGASGSNIWGVCAIDGSIDRGAEGFDRRASVFSFATIDEELK